jgi:hypothetical protein
MLKKSISSALALLAAAALGALLVLTVLPPAPVHSHSIRPEPVHAAILTPAPAAPEQPEANIVPSPVLPDAGVFIGTGDHSAGFWTQDRPNQ